jgi:tetratricopeptide (TPR) repeat protein
LIAAYLSLARSFEILEDLRLAIHYHQKTLDLTVALQDWRAAGKAHESLGIQLQKLGDITEACSHFENFLLFSKRIEDKEAESAASSHLISVYKQFAADFEASRDYESAIVYLQKCIEKAKTAQDTKSEGDTHYKLGQLYCEVSNDKKAIDHFTYYKVQVYTT